MKIAACCVISSEANVRPMMDAQVLGPVADEHLQGD
jgi:hypothetical protein